MHRPSAIRKPNQSQATAGAQLLLVRYSEQSRHLMLGASRQPLRESFDRRHYHNGSRQFVSLPRPPLHSRSKLLNAATKALWVWGWVNKRLSHLPNFAR